MKGFNTAASKLVENKYILGEPTKELLEDWDLRSIQSVLELHESSGGDKNCCGQCLFIIFNNLISFIFTVNVNCPSTGLDRGLVLLQTSDKGNVS